MMLRTHCQTSGVSLTEQDPYNNVVRTAYEALAAVLGGTQSLHTNSFDEAIALPTEFSARIARNTQLILAEETGVTHVVDPLGGSYYVEALTQSLADAAWELIEEVEALGGMTKAVESGMPKLRIEEAAARRQAAVDRGEETIVGVNKYRLTDEAPIDVRDDRQHRSAPAADRAARTRQGRTRSRDRSRPRSTRSPRVRPATATCSSSSVEASRARATVGEISDAMEAGVRPPPRGDPLDLRRVRRRVRGRRGVPAHPQGGRRRSPQHEGRRPRILVAKLGQDGHDRGAKVIATAFADLGFDVDIGPLFQTPEEAGARRDRERRARRRHLEPGRRPQDARAAADRSSCAAQGARDVVVVVGGVIPAGDYDFLKAAGVERGVRAGQQHPARRVRDPRARPRAPTSRVTPAPSAVQRARRRGARRRPARARPGDHARRSRAAPTTAPTRTRCSTRCMPATGQRGARRDHGRARRGQVDVHRSARDAPRRGRATSWRCSRSTRRAPAAAARSSATRRAWSDWPASERAFIRPSPSGGTLGRRRAPHARGDARVRGRRLATS